MRTQRKLIQEAHDKLDSVNYAYGNKAELCFFCSSAVYDEFGIVHYKDCIISKLRYKLGFPIIAKNSYKRS